MRDNGDNFDSCKSMLSFERLAKCVQMEYELEGYHLVVYGKGWIVGKMIV